MLWKNLNAKRDIQLDFFFERLGELHIIIPREREKGPKWTTIQCPNKAKEHKKKNQNTNTDREKTLLISCCNRMTSAVTALSTRNSPDPRKGNSEAKAFNLLCISPTPTLHFIHKQSLNGAQGRTCSIKNSHVAMEP
jgi:hypothetical protein